MTRNLTVRVYRTPPGSDIQKLIPVEDVTLEIRTSILLGPLWMPQRQRAVARRTLAEDDEDGLITVEIPDMFSAPRADGPVRIRASAPGHFTSGWVTIADTGDVHRHISLRPIGQWLEPTGASDFRDAIRFEDWDFNARVRAVVTFRGRQIDEDRRGLAGSVRFDRHDDEMTVNSLPELPVQVMPGLSGTVRIDTPVTGPFDPQSGEASMRIHGVVEVNGPLSRTSEVDITVSTQSSFPNIGMSGMAKTDNRIRLAGVGVFDSGALENSQIYLALTLNKLD